MTKVKFDVKGVPTKPFPMRDPHLGGAAPGHEPLARKVVPLPPEQEPYRLYTVDELGRFPPVTWLIDNR